MNLNDDIRLLRGVGDKKSAALHKMGIYSVGDFLENYPRRYEDRRNIKKISDLEPGIKSLISAKIISTTTARSTRNGGKYITNLLVNDESGTLKITFFNKYKSNFNFTKDREYFFYGKAEKDSWGFVMHHPEFSDGDANDFAGIIPVYPLTSGITANEMLRFQMTALECIDHLNDFLPEQIRLKYKLADLKYAVYNIHRPANPEALKSAAYRLIFDEFFLMWFTMMLSKNKNKTKSGISFSNVDLKPILSMLPFDLTVAQAKALSEILSDMKRKKTMNRLLQGDVGSGKTIVAILAMYTAAENGYQAVMMAPTELLAKQHYDELLKYFPKFGIRVGYLTGSLNPEEKRKMCAGIGSVEYDVIVGTHALFQDEVKYNNLGLIITDEQHRFGVKQRAMLKCKADNPDVLIMSATPIPRTLANILYADLDVSIIEESPLGRKKTITRACSAAERKSVYDFVYVHVKQGRQAYVVAPLISDNNDLNLKSVIKLRDGIAKRYPDIRVQCIHGDMKQAEKDSIMRDFANGGIDILVATVLIEVGINIPNATIMVIENAERFGLAQLHQLRGRIGRGSEQSYCVLITHGNSDAAARRAEIMLSSNDGFFIANEDLKLRGHGDIWGVRQHGIPDFKLADFIKHDYILKEAISAADEIISQKIHVDPREYDTLRQLAEKTYNLDGLEDI